MFSNVKSKDVVKFTKKCLDIFPNPVFQSIYRIKFLFNNLIFPFPISLAFNTTVLTNQYCDCVYLYFLH